LLDLRTADQLKELCAEFEIDAVRRSSDLVLAGLRSATRAPS
jgi:hypothetical protein